MGFGGPELGFHPRFDQMLHHRTDVPTLLDFRQTPYPFRFGLISSMTKPRNHTVAKDQHTFPKFVIGGGDLPQLLGGEFGPLSRNDVFRRKLKKMSLI